MATAGRILIIPRGGYSSATQYEQLDLVLHNGDSWLAKQNVKGVEPSDNNLAYWHRFTDVNSAFGGKIGTADISKIGDGTITGAIAKLDEKAVEFDGKAAKALYIVSFDEATGTLATKSADYKG